MREIGIMGLTDGDKVYIVKRGQVIDQGIVESWANHGRDNGGWVVTIKSDTGGYQNYWARGDYTFWV